jgi:hypothetical protein
VRNPYLQQLACELLDFYEKDQLDAFGLHVFGMVLKAASTTGGSPSTMILPPDSPSPQSILIQSILQFPYNWSAWLDLADIVINSATHKYVASNYSADDNDDDDDDQSVHPHQRQVERDIEEHLQPELGGHFMYHFPCRCSCNLRKMDGSLSFSRIALFAVAVCCLLLSYTTICSCQIIA